MADTNFVSARRATLLPRFATDGQHRRTQCCRHNVSSFCRGLRRCNCAPNWCKSTRMHWSGDRVPALLLLKPTATTSLLRTTKDKRACCSTSCPACAAVRHVRTWLSCYSESTSTNTSRYRRLSELHRTLGSRGFSLSVAWGPAPPPFRPQLPESEKPLEPRVVAPHRKCSKLYLRVVLIVHEEVLWNKNRNTAERCRRRNQASGPEARSKSSPRPDCFLKPFHSQDWSISNFSSTASPAILHHTVWRTCLFIVLR